MCLFLTKGENIFRGRFIGNIYQENAVLNLQFNNLSIQLERSSTIQRKQ